MSDFPASGPGPQTQSSWQRRYPPRPPRIFPFGAGAVNIPSAMGGNFQSFADFLATASNAQNLQQYFAGIAVRNVKVMQPYSALSQNAVNPINTTATQATVGSTTIVVASATGIAIGQSVEGAGVQANTMVTGVSGTTITISLATIAALSSTNVVLTSSTTPAIGYYGPGDIAEVLVRSSIVVVVNGTGTPQSGLPVYIRTVANANLAGTSVGDFEAAADLATSSITITATLGSTSLTTSAGTGLAIGQMVSGPGIAPNTYLTAGSGTSWTISQGAIAAVTTGAASFYNTALLGTVQDPFIVFRTGQIDSNNVAEVLIKNRHAA